MTKQVHIIGGGLAGSEAAWQCAEAGISVVLHEMRPQRKTDVHQTEGLAELVCSNSFRSDDATANAVVFCIKKCASWGPLSWDRLIPMLSLRAVRLRLTVTISHKA